MEKAREWGVEVKGVEWLRGWAAAGGERRAESEEKREETREDRKGKGKEKQRKGEREPRDITNGESAVVCE